MIKIVHNTKDLSFVVNETIQYGLTQFTFDVKQRENFAKLFTKFE